MSVNAVNSGSGFQTIQQNDGPVFQKGRIFLTAPNGRYVEVARSQHEKGIGDYGVDREDARDLVITAGSAEKDTYSETVDGVSLWKYEGADFAWRACDGVDYSVCGYAKFGRYWYNPANASHMAHITPMMEEEKRRAAVQAARDAGFHDWWNAAIADAPGVLQGPMSAIKFVAGSIIGVK